jgi:hypothetical protein
MRSEINKDFGFRLYESSIYRLGSREIFPVAHRFTVYTNYDLNPVEPKAHTEHVVKRIKHFLN